MTVNTEHLFRSGPDDGGDRRGDRPTDRLRPALDLLPGSLQAAKALLQR